MGVNASWQMPTPTSSGTCSSDAELTLNRWLLATCGPSPAKSPAASWPPAAECLGRGPSPSTTWLCWTDLCTGPGDGRLGSRPAHGYMSTRAWGRALRQHVRCPWGHFLGGLAVNHPSTSVDSTIGRRMVDLPSRQTATQRHLMLSILSMYPMYPALVDTRQIKEKTRRRILQV